MLFNYTPRTTHEVRIGTTPLGGGHPLRLQSMTTCATTDTEGCVAQCIRIIEAGADYVRLTTQGRREAENLRNIRDALRSRGYTTPLVADVHFNPNVADIAATIVEKVRINPGNYIDPARTFRHLAYTPEEYAAELARLRDRFCRLLSICREHSTALRIGVNHGSLSDRIMSHYGDTPEGIVESCMEFLRICQSEHFPDVAVSIKASNTVVMVQSVRLLVETMAREGMDYPLHLGVTEAGEGEDGRIKSAAGIGALLADGIGDTIRVSLSEAPEAEVPVAYALASYIARTRSGHDHIPAVAAPEFVWTKPVRRPTCRVGRIGGGQVPVVVTPRKVVAAAETEQPRADYTLDAHPCLRPDQLMFAAEAVQQAKREGGGVVFLALTYPLLTDEVRACLAQHPEIVVLAETLHSNPTGELRAIVHDLWRHRLTNPVVVHLHYGFADKQDFAIAAAADASALFFDGLADGLMLTCGTPDADPEGVGERLSFAVLQATRQRQTKTEYISCPGCGRTLYDLRSTIARIKAATQHLTGLKIGIMGCIVNGPGEMADADYGYVGAGPSRVSLYRGKTCVEKNIPEADAVAHLLALIEADQRP